ncbi:hypothetical protein [Streptomyces sp. NPDC050564]|uniref:hypothetical protein n=1 Tax=Streptomyces sp. NPDC050564 TaxID=3365631 RepID=UPI0037B2624E
MPAHDDGPPNGKFGEDAAAEDTENHNATVPVLLRLLALTPSNWHNHETGEPVIRSLTSYDH